VEWKPFELHPEIPPEGSTSPPVQPDRWKAMNDHLSQLAAEEGLELSRPETRSNSHLSLIADLFARDQGQQEPFHTRMFQAYWQQQRNIGRREVVLDVARESGLDTAELEQAIDDGRYEPELAAAYEQAHDYGISGVPTYIIGDYKIVGAQPYEVLEQALQAASE